MAHANKGKNVIYHPHGENIIMYGNGNVFIIINGAMEVVVVIIMNITRRHARLGAPQYKKI
jgi:hypothetical protein